MLKRGNRSLNYPAGDTRQLSVASVGDSAPSIPANDCGVSPSQITLSAPIAGHLGYSGFLGTIPTSGDTLQTGRQVHALAVIHILNFPIATQALGDGSFRISSTSRSRSGSTSFTRLSQPGRQCGRFDPTFLRLYETWRECAARNSTSNTTAGFRSLSFITAVPPERPPH